MRVTRGRAAAILIQGLVIGLLAGGIWFAAMNAAANFERLGINTGFRFLGQASGFEIAQHIIPFGPDSAYGDALLVALLNTLLLAAVAIIFATPLGFLIAIARRSGNGLVSGLAVGYVEILRNVPLLLQLFFWYFAVLRPLPIPHESLSLGGVLFLNSHGLQIPAPVPESGFWVVLAIFLASMVVAGWLIHRARQRREQTGRAALALPYVVCIPVGATCLAAAAMGYPLHWDIPHLARFNYEGGLALIPEFVAAALALSFYSATYIAEIVRGGLDSVSPGQIDAARALGLRPVVVYGKVLVPQAMRVILPPLANEYLRLVRNTTLAAAVAYPELMHVFAGTVLNQTAQAFEVMSITLAAYLVLGLIISGVMNVCQRRAERWGK